MNGSCYRYYNSLLFFTSFHVFQSYIPIIVWCTTNTIKLKKEDNSMALTIFKYFEFECVL